MLCGKVSFIQDDAYISLQYAKNFVNGNGLVFNIGERVEGFTSFLWVIILSFSYWLNINPEAYIQVLSIGFGILCLPITYFITKTIIRKYEPGADTNSYFYFLPVILLAVSGTFYYWAVSGMETTFYTFLCLVGIYYYLIRNGKTINLFLSMLFLTLAFLTRQEAVIIIFIFIGNSLLEQLRENKYKINLNAIFSRNFLFAMALFTIPSIIFVSFRLLYYGYLFPNTFYAKTGASLVYFKTGLEYTTSFFERYLLYGAILILPLILLANKKLREILFLIYAIIVSYIVYVVFVGGDVLAMHRFYIPVLPLIYILFTIFLYFLYQSTVFFFKSSIIRTTVIIGIVSAICLNIHLNNYKDSINMSGKERNFTSLMENIGLKMKEEKKIKRRQLLIAASTIGALKYFSGCKILDMLGLTNKYIAHHPSLVKTISDYNSGWKERNYNAKYVLTQKPDYIIFSTGEKPSSYAERALFINRNFFNCYFVYPLFIDSTGIPRNIYKRYSRKNIILREHLVQKNKNYSPSFVNLYVSFLNHINHREYVNHLEDIKTLFYELIKYSPSYFGEPYRFMATIYHDKGNDLEAIKYLNKCLKADPLNLYARMITYKISKTKHLKVVAEQQVKFLRNYFPGVCSQYRFINDSNL